MGQPNVTCPLCGRWGSRELNDRCKPCHDKEYDDEKNIFDDFCDSYDRSEGWFPENFGIIKDKFGCER